MRPIKMKIVSHLRKDLVEESGVGIQINATPSVYIEGKTNN